MDENTELLRKILDKLDAIDSVVVQIKDGLEETSARSE